MKRHLFTLSLIILLTACHTGERHNQRIVDQIAALRPGDLLELGVHVLEAARNAKTKVLAESYSLYEEIILLGFGIRIGHFVHILAAIIPSDN